MWNKSQPGFIPEKNLFYQSQELKSDKHTLLFLYMSVNAAFVPLFKLFLVMSKTNEKQTCPAAHFSFHGAPSHHAQLMVTEFNPNFTSGSPT